MPKGSQAWNCYGSRNNEYLMMNYGFCFLDNLYTSYTFCVRLDVDFETIETIELKHMVAPSGMRGNIQQIRLKNNQFNDILIAYIRSLLKEQYIRNSGKSKAKSTKILLTRIYEDDIEFELECLKRYQEIVKHYQEQLESISTLESDMELLDNPPEGLHMSSNQRMAVTFRAENKRIVRSHVELIRYVLNVV